MSVKVGVCTIHTMSKDNINEIYNFETENREFFEQTLPPRPEGYFSIESFNVLMHELLQEQENSECFMHIIRNTTGDMVGRANLYVMNDKTMLELGYRIGEVHQGNGFASDAVKQLIEMAHKKYCYKRIQAGTSTENIGSQRVLEKNGFRLIGEENNVMQVNNRWIDGFLYELQYRD